MPALRRLNVVALAYLGAFAGFVPVAILIWTFLIPALYPGFLREQSSFVVILAAAFLICIGFPLAYSRTYLWVSAHPGIVRLYGFGYRTTLRAEDVTDLTPALVEPAPTSWFSGNADLKLTVTLRSGREVVLHNGDNEFRRTIIEALRPRMQSILMAGRP